ncbi:hypothetical protein WIS52_17705 [Pseudonocardia nematodicida]|uniref:DUF3311 domain-containing protein n=1 Tax=Pseudonocardia nematodicida TaxID=1206997 RepID=A0ABV1KCX9_9PSEU
MDRRRSADPDPDEQTGSSSPAAPIAPTGVDPAAEREPIRSPWLFAVLFALVLVGTPLWYPTGAIEPLVFGVPFWFAIAVATTVLFSAMCCWICLRRWNLVEPVEQATGAPIGPVPGADDAEDHRTGGHRTGEDVR